MTPGRSLDGYRFIDLFAGIGGFHLALSSFGAQCVFASEWDEPARFTYEANHGLKPCGDITKIDTSTVPAHDILCGGFPCQAFSISGKQQGFNDTRGTLFFEIARIAKAHQPRMLLLENVKNLEKHNNGTTLNVIKQTLDDLGYAVFHKVLDASQYGVPQKRERIYIVGFRKDLNVRSFDFPAGLPVTRSVQSVLLPADEVAGLIVDRPDMVTTNPDPKTGLILPTVYRAGYVNKGGQGERIYYPSGQGITLSAYGGGVGAKTGLYLVNGIVRKLAPRECARLLGLPDSFQIHPNRHQAYKQFGNSVVVDVLKHILNAILDQTTF